MGVRQLEEFLGQADQKGFWIFTYANLGGGFVGAFLGNSLIEMIAPSISWLKMSGIVLGVLLGVVVTWKVKGYPIYKWALSYTMFVLRRYLKVGLGDSTIEASLYYRARSVKQEPFMLVTTRDGRPVPVMVHRGSGTGNATDLLDGLLLPADQGGEWNTLSTIRFRRQNSAESGASMVSAYQSGNGDSPNPPQLPAVEERSDPGIGGWEF